jgi:hypothetical protein
MYHGNLPSQNFVSLKRQDVTGSGSASVTLDHSVSSINDILVYVNEVKQNPNDMSVSANILTLGGTISASDSCYIIFLGQALQTVNPADNTVTLDMLTASGTKSSSTFLRGDNTFAVPTDNGKVLQVVTATDSTGRSTTSTSYVTASNTLTVNITPSSTSSKILVMVSGNLYNNSSSQYGYATIYRDSTDLGASGNKGLTNIWTGNSDSGAPLHMHILDSPSTTSQITYQVYIKSSGGSVILNENSPKGSITAFEIGA